MAKKDAIHDAVKNALIKDGWTITSEHFELKFEERRLYVDLAAQRPVVAEKGDEKIVVEIKTFVGASLMNDLENAVGQYNVYLTFLEILEPVRKLFLAITDVIFYNFFQEKAVQLVINRFKISLLVVDVEKEEVVRWIK